jgi:hypothetical protein
VDSILQEAAVPPKYANAVTGSLRSLPDLIPPDSYGPEQFNVYFVKEFQVNGVYIERAIFVKDTSSLRAVPGGIAEPLPRVTSHELGHAHGLAHRQDTTNLMASGTTGTSLNVEEIENARTRAEKMIRFVSAPHILEKADAYFDSERRGEACELYRRLRELPLDESSLSRIEERLLLPLESATRAVNGSAGYRDGAE